MKLGAIAVTVATLALAGCGSSGGDEGTRAATVPAAATSTVGETKFGGKLPPGAVDPVDTAEEAAAGPAANEASPEASANGPQSTGELTGADRTAATAAVRDFIVALDRRDPARVCGLIVPGGLDRSDLPRNRGGCRPSVRASIGTRPPGGGPAWRQTQVVEMKPEALGEDRARITSTVTHRFSDREYVSVEDDVIYLEKLGGRWLLAKPSATFYRAVGYAQPPLRAFAPPPGW
jgi:hypothetical protein